MGGEPAKQAALEVAGGELPTSIVQAPAPHVQEEVTNMKLWSDADGSQKVMSDDLRQALQSQAVIAALQRSLAVRAAEMREGLRQWGFACSATARTQELCKVLESSLDDAKQQANKFTKEAAEKLRERSEEASNVQRSKQEVGNQQQLHTRLLEQLSTLQQRSVALQKERDEKTNEAETCERGYDQRMYEHSQAERELETSRAALAEHPAEAERRLTAQKRLVQMANDQLQRSTIQLQQTQAQLSSFQQSHQAVAQSHHALADALGTEKVAFESLRGDHGRMHLELESLARHYVAALPPLPGLEQFSCKVDPRTSGLMQSADGLTTPKSITTASRCNPESPGNPTFGASPDHPRQVTHVDPTGEGALSAGGRLVMSI